MELRLSAMPLGEKVALTQGGSKAAQAGLEKAVRQGKKIGRARVAMNVEICHESQNWFVW